LRAGRRPSKACVVKATAQTETLVETKVKVVVKDVGSASLRGTVRKVNEDRQSVHTTVDAAVGQPTVFAGVYDGHGGSATAEWLKDKLHEVVQKHWRGGVAPEEAITEAFLQADKKLLSPKSGFMGLGERGVGGSKCGATAATVTLFQEADGTTKLLAANIGDARTVLIRGGEALQLSSDHVPDVEDERKRIERYNPNPKMPLVRYVAGTWRVGGLLALSRAFGDAYLKGSGQFEGVPAGSDGYSSGFGVIAEPHAVTTTLTAEDSWLVVASDGLYAEEERGGGGGLDNQQLVDILKSAGNDAACATIADALAQAAVQMGSTDDVTLIVMRLGTA